MVHNQPNQTIGQSKDTTSTQQIEFTELVEIPCIMRENVLHGISARPVDPFIEGASNVPRSRRL